MRPFAITSLALLAAVWAAPAALADMAGKSESTVKRTTAASASASASASSSATATAGKGAGDCRSSARSEAFASANGQESYDSDEEIRETSSGDCSARAQSRASASTAGKKDDPDSE